MDRMDKVNMMEEAIVEQLGYEGAFNALSKALSYDKKEDVYEYITRCYEIKIEEEDDEEECNY